MKNNKENIQVVISLSLAGLLIGAILWLLGKVIRPEREYSGEFQQNNVSLTPSYINSPLNHRMSLGEKIFITEGRPPDKEAGRKAFEAGDFATAVSKFQVSLQNKRNDPETLIYLNNAKIGKSKALKVAVVVPIGISLNEAEEILRGVAQAQDEVNSNGGINGLPLQLQIVSINNFEILKQLDTELVNDPSILAVVGFSQDTSIYNKRGLVMVSLVNSKKLSKPTKYIFYATPSSDVFGDALASYIVQKARLTNIAICSDSTFTIRNEIVEVYTESIRKYGGRVTSTVCDLGGATFQPSSFLSRTISDGAEGLLLLPRPDKLNSAIEVARENKGRLPLFGFQAMYTERTLKYGQADVKGMMLAVSWHHDAVASKSFAQKAIQLWGGDVSPRTATAYDALQTIITGLRQGDTREELQKALSNPDFSALGATGTIQFPRTGARLVEARALRDGQSPAVGDAPKGSPPRDDRKSGVFLVKIAPCDSKQACNSSTGYRFKLVQ
ncbi:ABC transporter substrate-binding protein [Mastigocladopsis repens]|uniref:ABC transporter substrate-binding protein n=1 Tax=Mastigocladopsis repens TaxID=221287 RepID=UPI0002DF95F0|nr:ABC transporter substrate-binding protein [Mastigocladopsis repens]